MKEKKYQSIRFIQKSKIIFSLKYYILFFIIEPSLSSDCNKTHPIKRGDQCILGECTSDEFTSKTCTVGNDIIKEQWLTSIIPFTGAGYDYTMIDTSPNGDLIASSTQYSQTLKYYYCLKKNGRPYFVNSAEETPFANTDSSIKRLEGNIFAIKINGTDNDKEYIVGFGNGVAYFELYDFKDNGYDTYKVEGKTFFNTGYNYFRIGTIFKLKTEDDYYIIGIMAQTKSNEYCFILMKLLFNSINIESYSPIVKTETLKSDSTNNGKSYISTCFESDNNYIICFYRDDSNFYVMAVYNQELELQKSEEITSTSNSGDHFFKCVHFTEDTGAFLFYDTNSVIVKFKKYVDGNIKDHFNNIGQIAITNNNFRTEVKMNDMIKFGDKKFCFITMAEDKKSLNLVVVNSYDNEKFKIRYYVIQTYNLYIYLLTEQLKSTLYNGFVALASNGKINKGSGYGTLIIFSYPNSTDFSIDITDEITSFVNPVIKLYENCKIENNIFGYIFVGVQIYNFSEGLKLLYENDETEILKYDIIPNGTNIELVLTKNLDIENNLKIEYIMVLTEPDYDIYNLFPETIDNNYCGSDCDEERNKFTRSLYYGRTSYVDISFEKNKISSSCDENCAFCLTDEESSCIICKFLYESLDNGRKKCLMENEVPQTQASSTEITEIMTEEEIKSTEVVTNHATDILTETTVTTKETNIKTANLIDSTDIMIPTTKGLIDSTEIMIPTTKGLIDSTDIMIPTIESTDKETIFKEVTTISMSSSPPSTEKITISREDTALPIEESTLSVSTFPNKNTNILTESIIEENTIKINNCTDDDIIRNKCDQKISNSQMEAIKENLLYNNYTKENIIIKTKNVIVQLSTTKDQETTDDPDVSNIFLGECENILKRENNIPPEESLIIYKTDIKIDETNTYVQYEVYDPIELGKLSLDVCSKEQISLNVPVVFDFKVETLHSSLEKSGYNLFNKSDSFYQDICATYTSLNGTDMPLSDRKKDIYTASQIKTVCQTGCELESYNSTNQKAKCICSVATNSITDFSLENIFKPKEIEQKFFESLSNSNFRVLKCYKLIFDLSRIKKNIGEILMTVIFLVIIILLMAFCIIDQKNLKKNIKFLLDFKSTNVASQKRKSISKKSKRFSVVNKTNLKLKNDEKMKEKEKIKEKAKGKDKKELEKPKKVKKKKKTKKMSNFPPKRKVLKSKSSSINKNSSSRRMSKKQVNNNILFNVQLINQKESKRKTSIFSPLNKVVFQKKKKIKNRDSIISNSNTRKSLKNVSPSLSSLKKDNAIPFKLKDYRALNDQELNNLKYELAVVLDKRTYFQYYWSLLKQKQLILFTFFLSNDYNLLTLKISLFLISFCLYFTINGFFFTDETMHNVYKNNGAYDIISKIPQLLYSTIVSTIINMILKLLSLSEKSFLEIKEEKNKNLAIEKSKKIEKSLKIKFSIFFSLSILFMGFFWYFISCFCKYSSNSNKRYCF